jgi:cation transport ATPase
VLKANVNLANEKATVRYLGGEIDPRDLEKAVEEAGYGVVQGEESSIEDSHEHEYRKLGADFLVAAALTALIPVATGILYPLFSDGSVPETLRPVLGEYGFLNQVLAAAAMALSLRPGVHRAWRGRRRED